MTAVFFRIVEIYMTCDRYVNKFLAFDLLKCYGSECFCLPDFKTSPKILASALMDHISRFLTMNFKMRLMRTYKLRDEALGAHFLEFFQKSESALGAKKEAFAGPRIIKTNFDPVATQVRKEAA